MIHVPKRFDQAKDDRDETQRQNDTTVQDFITHADFWIGVACLSCVFLSYFDGPLIRSFIFVIGLASMSWLVVLGLLTGMLYKTNQGAGIKSFLAPDQSAPALPSDQGPQGEVTRAAGFVGIVFLVWFLVEAVLIVAGIYYTGWVQYVLGAIALAWAAAALVRGLSSIAVNNAMKARVRAMAAEEVKNGNAAKLIQEDPVTAKRAQAKADATAHMHRQLLILTIADFSLAAAQGFVCVMMNEPYVWIGPVTVASFLCAGLWMMLLGKVTGHGNPGHHVHPMDKSEETFEKQKANQKSIAELLEEARRERERGA